MEGLELILFLREDDSEPLEDTLLVSGRVLPSSDVFPGIFRSLETDSLVCSPGYLGFDHVGLV